MKRFANITSSACCTAALLACALFAFNIRNPHNPESIHVNLMNFTMILWIVTWIADLIVRRDNVSFHRPDRVSASLYLTLMLAAWMTLSFFWTDNLDDFLSFAHIRLPMVVLPLLALFGMPRQFRFRRAMFAFAMGVLFYTVALLFFSWEALPYSEQNPSAHFVWYYNELQHRTHFGVCQIMALCILAYLRPQLIRRLHSRGAYRLLFIFAWLVVMTALLFSEGRLMLALALLFSLSFLLRFLWLHNWRRLSIAIIPLSILAAAVFFPHHPRLQQFRNLSSQEIQAKEPRYDQWRCAMMCIQDKDHNIFLGEGMGDASGTYNRMRHDKSLQDLFHPISDPFESAHNQFLQGQLEYGLIGSVIFLALLVSFFFAARGSHARFFVFQVAVIWISLSLIEQLFSKTQAVDIFCYSLLFCYWVKCAGIRESNA